MARTKNTANSLMSPTATRKHQNASTMRTTSSKPNYAAKNLPQFSWHHKLTNNSSMSPTAYTTQQTAFEVMQPNSSAHVFSTLNTSIQWHKSLSDSSQTMNSRDQFRAYLALQKSSEERALREQREREYFRKKFLILNGIDVDTTEAIFCHWPMWNI